MKPGNGFTTMLFAASVALTAAGADAVERKGFVIGLGAGVGQTRIEGESNTAIGSDFHIGGMLGERTALLLEAYGVTDSEDDATVSFGVSTVSIQRWLSDKFWVKGGVGRGFVWASADGHSELDGYGVGILAATGYEVVQRRRFTLDLQGRFSTASSDGVRVNNFGVNLGFNWW